MNKKYLPSALILYLNYFIHGVGCSILETGSHQGSTCKILGCRSNGDHSNFSGTWT